MPDLPRTSGSGSAERLMAWAEDYDLGRLGFPHYANPSEVKRDIRETVVALREMFGSYEALARMMDAGDSRPFAQTMKWDGPTCARRVLGRNDA